MQTRISNALFMPIQIGKITLKHRFVMALLTRLWPHRLSGVPSDLMLEYYSQRASDGGLIVSESTAVSPSGHGYHGAPGIYSKEQVAGWQKIVNAVHKKGGRMIIQLWHAGRCPHTSVTHSTPISASIDPTYWADYRRLRVSSCLRRTAHWKHMKFPGSLSNIAALPRMPGWQDSMESS